MKKQEEKSRIRAHFRNSSESIDLLPADNSPSNRVEKTENIETRINCEYEASGTFNETSELDVRNALLHAIDLNLMASVEWILAHDPCNDLEIEGDHYFEEGTTPMLLAAHKNNYRVLELLHKKYGHPLLKYNESDANSIGSEDCKISRKRRAICKARIQPAYITIHVELKASDARESNANPFDYCLDEIKTLREFGKSEKISCDFYDKMEKKLEDYMCLLLDSATRSSELEELLDFKYPDTFKWSKLVNYTKRNSPLLKKASDMQLIRFVAHHHSQEAVSCLLYAPLPEAWYWAVFPALMFPIFSLFQWFMPKSAPGGIASVPVVSLVSWMVSNIIFAALMFAKRLVTPNQLGQPLHPLEWVVFLWILSKWVQEITELKKHRLKYLRDVWNFFDILLNVVVTFSFLVRIHDVIHNTDHPLPRYQWNDKEWMLLANAADASSYVLISFQMMRHLTIQRNLGPIIISATKIIQTVVPFTIHYVIMVTIFAISLLDLYAYYNTIEGIKFVCGESDVSEDATIPPSDDCLNNRFRKFPHEPLLLVMLGLFEIEELELNKKHSVTVFTGELIVDFYLFFSTIFMLNVLIAIVTNSYCKIKEDEDTAWKFHRTTDWLWFTGDSAPRPLPMNLIPRMKTIEKCRKNPRYILIPAPDDITDYNKTKYPEVSVKLMKRYKVRHLINSKKLGNGTVV